MGFLGIPKSFRGLRGLAVNAQYPQKIEPSCGVLGYSSGKAQTHEHTRPLTYGGKVTNEPSFVATAAALESASFRGTLDDPEKGLDDPEKGSQKHPLTDLG